MLAVIPLGRNRSATLPYVLRALGAHTPITRLVTVGEAPAGITPDLHIPSPNNRLPHMNVLGHLRRVCESIDVSEFIWTDDDTFPIKTWTPGVYVRTYSIAQHLRHYPNRGAYSTAAKASVKVMVAAGHDPEKVPCGPIHRPWLVQTERVLETVEALEAVGGGSFKTLYVAGLTDVIPAGDPKIHGRGMPKPGADVISLGGGPAWRANAGRLVRETFREPSRWEAKDYATR